MLGRFGWCFASVPALKKRPWPSPPGPPGRRPRSADGRAGSGAPGGSFPARMAWRVACISRAWGELFFGG